MTSILQQLPYQILKKKLFSTLLAAAATHLRDTCTHAPWPKEAVLADVAPSATVLIDEHVV
jgi:hypothetical protein